MLKNRKFLLVILFNMLLLGPTSCAFNKVSKGSNVKATRTIDRRKPKVAVRDHRKQKVTVNKTCEKYI